MGTVCCRRKGLIVQMTPLCLCINNSRVIVFLLHRQFVAALADLNEALKLCPNNQEIKRLLARVEEEFKQHQKSQQQKQNQPLPPPSNDSDQEDEAVEETLDHHLSLEEIQEDDGPSSDILPANSKPLDVPNNHRAAEYITQKFHTELSEEHPGKNICLQQALVQRPAKQAQIVKTNQHMNSLQSLSRSTNSFSALKTQAASSTLAPPSPLPLRPSSNQASMRGPTVEARGPAYTEKVPSGLAIHRQPSEVVQSYKASGSFVSKTAERLVGFPVPEKPAAVTESKRIASHSLTSSSSFSEGVKGPDVRSKENKPNQIVSASADQRPRNIPFMGIMDKTARSFQQNVPPARSWQNQTDLNPNPPGTGSSAGFEKFVPRQVTSYSNLNKTMPNVYGGNTHNGVYAKDFEDGKCQTSSLSQDSKAVAKSYQEAMLRSQSVLAKDSKLGSMSSAKPKRSFIESNV